MNVLVVLSAMMHLQYHWNKYDYILWRNKLPVYPVVNLKTGEKKELTMSISIYEEWRKNNPEWDKDWNAGIASVGEVGEWRDKLIKKNPGWNDVLHKASKAPGSRVKPI